MDEGKILRLNATQNTPKANAALATAMKTKIQWYVQQGMTVEGKQDFVPLAAASYFLVQLSRHIKAESKLTWREYIMDDADVAKEKLTEEGMEGILAGEPFEYFYEGNYVVCRNLHSVEDREYTVYHVDLFELLGNLPGVKLWSNLSLKNIVGDMQSCNNGNILFARKAEIRFHSLMGQLQQKDWNRIIEDAFHDHKMDEAIAQALASPPQIQSAFLDRFAPEMISFILHHQSEYVTHDFMSKLNNKTWAILFPHIPLVSQHELCEVSRSLGINNISLYCADVTKVPEELQTSEVSQAYIDVYKWLVTK